MTANTNTTYEKQIRFQSIEMNETTPLLPTPTPVDALGTNKQNGTNTNPTSSKSRNGYNLYPHHQHQKHHHQHQRVHSHSGSVHLANEPSTRPQTHRHHSNRYARPSSLNRILVNDPSNVDHLYDNDDEEGQLLSNSYQNSSSVTELIDSQEILKKSGTSSSASQPSASSVSTILDKSLSPASDSTVNFKIVELIESPQTLSSPRWSLYGFQWRTIKLSFYLISSVLIAVANSLTWKRTLNRFRAVDGTSRNMEFFVTQWTVFLYVALASIILAYRWCFTNAITAAQRAYPQRNFVFMGLLDSIAGLCSSLGGAFASGQVQTIINQANIPVTMILSRLFLLSQFNVTQYFGAALITLGSVGAIIPSSDEGSASADTVFDEDSGSSTSSTFWYGPLILLFSTLPNSFSNVYKEHNFKVDGLDVYFLTTFVSLYQVLLGFLFMPLISLPSLGGTSISELPLNLVDGWRCFTGERLHGFTCHHTPYPYVILLSYVLVNFAYNVLLLLITKHGSALLLVIASAISLPITNLFFTSSFIMGEDAEHFHWQNWVGLLCTVCGFLLYSLVMDDTGEFMPAQGPAGQMMYVTEDAPHSHLNMHFRRNRSNSFDITSSPLFISESRSRKKEAQRKFWKQRANEIESNLVRALEPPTFALEDTWKQQHDDDSRYFFTPP